MCSALTAFDQFAAGDSIIDRLLNRRWLDENC
jgi:hypothetical protein